jgi:uncharacterized protein YdeI (YjbR/CyaY-like superfamily)
MPRSVNPKQPVFFADAGEFRRWLAANAATAGEIFLGYHKINPGKPSLTWPESVDEALCVGWIDGVRKRIDDHSYQIRFSARRADSVWSSINIARAEVLIREGRMQPAGLAAFGRRTARKSSIYSYEQEGTLTLSAEEITTFRRDKNAWAHLQSTPPEYRKSMIHWVVSASREATRVRRLQKFIEACAAGKRLVP